MADPICRWRNPYVSTIIELVKVLPHRAMPSDEFRMIVEKKWPGFFHTPYQLACQVGLYYESDDGQYYPRFDHDINEAEALSYMKSWITRYYVPNPYTRSIKHLDQPKPFLAAIIGYVYEHPDEKRLHAILEAVFKEDIGNIDIISNVINTYADIIKVDTLGNIELTAKAIDFMKQYLDRNDKKAFFEHFSESKTSIDNNLSKNLIFYGAPGTGKSKTIKREVDDKGLPNVRTTFHPDSDYATFVGAYKPTTTQEPKMTLIGTKQVPVEGGKPESKIIYEFVPQAFLKAYTGAWKNLEQPFYLIIEEINRGNCAQIFGDLFQMLDRNDDGESEYPISPDDDILRFLQNDKKYGFAALTDEQKAAIPDDVLSGKELRLPKNLFIWATMNTSDQSLFPIDSAFKRRWDWQYIPITDAKKGWKIEAAGNLYDWWQFLEKINEQIGNTTNSEDKKLGYFFCKANGSLIKADKFVSKVVFYLWNDVFKDFAEEAGGLFVDTDSKILSFSKFYTTGADGKAVVKEDKVALFLQNLGLEPLPLDENGDIPDNGDDNEIEQFIVEYNGEKIEGTPSNVLIETINRIGLDKFVDRKFDGSVLVTKEKPEKARSRKVGDYYVNTGLWPTYKRRWLQVMASEMNIDLKIE